MANISAQSLTQLPAWRKLAAHYGEIGKIHLRELFAEDPNPNRGERFTVDDMGIYLDYSKNRITGETLHLLQELAESCGLREHIDAMFHGEKINMTENRAVLHVALRTPLSESIFVDGENVVPEVHKVLDRMADFANRVRSGNGKDIRANASAMS